MHQWKDVKTPPISFQIFKFNKIKKSHLVQLKLFISGGVLWEFLLPVPLEVDGVHQDQFRHRIDGSLWKQVLDLL